MHFTYQPPEGDLRQGDLLSISDDLQEILEKYHPHYANNPDYRYLIVLTQSCDLWRRQDGKCKSRYITLSAVRPIDTVIQRELEKHQRSSIERNNSLCSIKSEYWVKDFLIKLLNNNLQEYFYLAEDPEIGLHSPHIAFLALSIAIKSEHYDMCLKARIAQLKEIFQAKLGWLVGEVYSRVGTPDWVPTKMTKEEFDKYVDKFLDRIACWVTDNVLEQLKDEQKRRRKEFKDHNYVIPPDEVSSLLNQYAEQQETKKERIIDIIVQQTSNTVAQSMPVELEKLKMRLMNDEQINMLLA